MKKKDTSILRGLQYFEAVARHRSMRSAAQDLKVTESAVSHQMREFAASIGQQLLVKSGRGIALTATGELLAAKLISAFAGLETLVKGLAGDGRNLLQLAVCSSFGPGWLVERLDHFFAAHPEIDLQLRLYAQDPALTNEVADAFVTTYPVKAGFASIRLMDEMLIAVQAPAKETMRKRGAKHRLITTELKDGKLGRDWINYCKRAGLRLADLQDTPWLQCTHYLLALEMAKSGLGVALVPDFLAAKGIKSGALVAFSKTLMPSKRVYHLCYRKTRGHEAKLATLAQWIKSQMAETSVAPKSKPTSGKAAGADRRAAAV